MTEAEILALPYRRGVGVMLVNRSGLVFVGQRLDSDTPAWQMVQGGVDKGEEPEAAALRELEEEAGVPASAVAILGAPTDWLIYDLPHDVVPHVWKGRYRGQTQQWFLMRLEGPDSLIDIARPHPEFREWRWSPVSELVEMIVPFKRPTYRAVIAAFADRLAP